MKGKVRRVDSSLFVLGFILVGLIFASLIKTAPSFADEGLQRSEPEAQISGENFVTIYDNGQKLTLKSTAATVAEVLERVKIELTPNDVVEPALDEPITGGSFNINIYRAKPALVIDGIRRISITTAVSDPRAIVMAAGIELNAEDVVEMHTAQNFLEAGISVSYQVVRAKNIALNFYGDHRDIRTQAKTVADFLAEQNITLTEDDWISASLDQQISDGVSLAIYRQGKQTITLEETMPFTEKITYDYSRNAGYRSVLTEGKNGSKTVTYEIEMQNGQEVSRVAISEIVTVAPIAQEVVVGAHPIAMNPLTASMGRNRYTTASGILREETYYDLDMSIVMLNCGSGGYYTVREDGVKVDKDGYVIVAAQLDRYPRCTIVETSLGLGKVYDTGGFALVNPEQFDIATDWTKRDGI